MQVRKSPEVHDVVIIGSGASGGMAAWNLTRQGMQRAHAGRRHQVPAIAVLEPREAVAGPAEDSPPARSRRSSTWT